jgi:hypothetical protein
VRDDLGCGAFGNSERSQGIVGGSAGIWIGLHVIEAFKVTKRIHHPYASCLQGEREKEGLPIVMKIIKKTGKFLIIRLIFL